MSRRPGAQLAAVVTVAVAVAGFVAVDATRGGAPRPRLRFVQEVPTDVRRETDATYARFLDRFDARTPCIGDVSVELVRELADGDARYVAAERRIEIRIPTTPGRYRESLAHELAHHLERTCAEFDGLREEIGPRMGADATAWSAGPTWEETPSERFAEAVVELVNGERIRHVDTVPVDPQTLELIARWGRRSPLLVDR